MPKQMRESSGGPAVSDWWRREVSVRCPKRSGFQRPPSIYGGARL